MILSLVVVQGGLAPRPAYAQVGTIYYVDKDRPDDSGDGLSWATAKRNLQSALALATAGAQIWVADGTYYPDEGTGQTNNNRDATFSLKDGVAIYGGFAGTETLLTERDVAANVAILSGDLDQSGTATNNDAYHVVTSDGNATTALLDGFTITGGNANGSNPQDRGGGIYTFNSSQAQFAALTISGNDAIFGSGVFNDSSSPSYTNVTISGNTAFDDGGGVYND
ncbi:MAG: cadherin, partial [Chloroflexaceae bacterium]|nr:cadherin [Chloroflexaceae bacterium]